MIHLPNLIIDLGLILIAAAIVTLVFKKLNQPVVLGYLIAGFLVGPNFTFLPTVKDSESITIWAEIGVIFMLFGLGLEFSFKKLTQVGKSASITASFEIFSMLGIGYLVGQFLNWSTMDSIFLGGILSISSTTIIVRAFDELGLKSNKFVSLVFGTLIVEDLIAILLLVLLSSVAATQAPSGMELLASSLRLGFFLVLWFLLGIYLLPLMLKKFKDLLSDETMLIVSIGLCLMMVIIASHVGFSPALGAFVMGSLLAETPKGTRVEHLILPVKDLFSAVFFVSVGMLIDPKILGDYFWVIMFLTFITIIGKFISTAIGFIVSGQSFKSSVQAGMSLAQIGEFSFIIATLGVTLKVTSDFLYPIAVAVSAITTFTTPYFIKFSDPFATWLERKLPAGLKESLFRYETIMSTSSSSNVLLLVWKEYGIKIMLNAVMVVAITLAISRLILPYFFTHFSGDFLSFTAGTTTLILSAPFLWAIFVGGPQHSSTYQAETAEQLRRLQFGISIVRLLLGFAIIGFIVSNFTSALAFSGVILIGVTTLGIFFFSRYSEPIYKKIENRFISHLTANELAEIEKKSKVPELAPWNATLTEFQVSPQSPLILKSLQESRIKEQYGVTVAMIERGDAHILAPTREDILLPGDNVFLIGTDDQLDAVRGLIEKEPADDSPDIDENFGLVSFLLTSQDIFINQSIRECGIREAVNGLIVGLERDGQRHLNPDSSMILQASDLIWLVGDKSLIKQLRSKHD